MSEDIWDILEIAATDDASAVKRAYQSKLKRTNPEDDPEGFQQLRAAYDRAVREISWGWHTPDTDSDDDEISTHAENISLPGGDIMHLPMAPAVHVANTPALPLPEADLLADLQAPLPTARAEKQDVPPRADLLDDLEMPLPVLEAVQDAGEAMDARSLWQQQANQFLYEYYRDAAGTETHAEFDKLLAVTADAPIFCTDDINNMLAELLLDHQPGAAAFLQPAIDRLGWVASDKTSDYRAYTPYLDAVIRHQASQQVLADLNKRAADNPRGNSAALLNPPRPGLYRLRSLFGDFDRHVAKALDEINNNHPGLRPQLNADALAWWESFLQKPRLNATFLRIWLAMSVVAPLHFMNDTWLGQTNWIWLALIPIIMIAGLAAHYFCYTMLRHHVLQARHRSYDPDDYWDEDDPVPTRPRWLDTANYGPAIAGGIMFVLHMVTATISSVSLSLLLVAASLAVIYAALVIRPQPNNSTSVWYSFVPRVGRTALIMSGFAGYGLLMMLTNGFAVTIPPDTLARLVFALCAFGYTLALGADMIRSFLNQRWITNMCPLLFAGLCASLIMMLVLHGKPAGWHIAAPLLLLLLWIAEIYVDPHKLQSPLPRVNIFTFFLFALAIGQTTTLLDVRAVAITGILVLRAAILLLISHPDRVKPDATG